jgi:hypothetical protein
MVPTTQPATPAGVPLSAVVEQFDLEVLTAAPIQGADMLHRLNHAKEFKKAMMTAKHDLQTEGGNTWFGTNAISGGDLLWGGSIYFGLDTPFAPLYIAYGNTDGNRNAVYFYLGQVF